MKVGLVVGLAFALLRTRRRCDLECAQGQPPTTRPAPPVEVWERVER